MSTGSELKVVDLFAGAGGFSQAARLAGGELVFAVEFDKHAAETYRKNLGSTNPDHAPFVYNEDITKLSAESLAKKHFPEGSSCDLLLGGPPCQGFSTHRINDAGVDDPRNGLIHEYFKFVEALKPRVFLMENVPGMLWPRHAKYLEQFYLRAAEAGYYVYAPQKLDARDFGVPQRRKRVFILGVRNDLDRSDLHWPPAPTHAEVAKMGLKRWISCRHVFRPAPADDPNDFHMKHGPTLIAAFEKTPHNGGSRKDSGRKLPCHEAHDGHKDVYGRINPAVPGPTMTTACINPSKGRFVHPTLNHGITARQAARFQTFPDSFVFHGGLMAAGKQIGNAVPVKLGAALISHLKVFLATNKEGQEFAKAS